MRITVTAAKKAVVFFLLIFLSACAKTDTPQTAQGLEQKSQEYYAQAVSAYQKLIAQGKDASRESEALGELYYRHGEFEKAVEVLEKARNPQAKKFLALAYDRLGNYTDALEVFDSSPLKDDEYLYFYGLTCEKKNLFDQALDVYETIAQEPWRSQAAERMGKIEAQSHGRQIGDVDPQVHDLLANAPEAERYPQAGVLILRCDEKVDVTADYKEVSTLHYVIKILNERGKEGFSETAIDYDSTYEKVELEYARTIKPDGTVVEVGSRHIRDVSRYLNFPLYSNARVFIISFPEIVEGAVIEYKVKVYRNQLINKKDFILNYPVQSSEPILSARFVARLPKAMPLKIKLLNERYNTFGATLMPQKVEDGDCMVYTWDFKDIPQIIPESNMPADVAINPTILLSTFTRWEDVYQWWWALAKDKIQGGEVIKDKARELTQGLSSEEDKVRAIYNFCAQKPLCCCEYGQAGYEPHQAEDIKDKYGDCKDQACVIVALLRSGYLGLICYGWLL